MVTLEPCAHPGRTGPCTEALIAAVVARVVHRPSRPEPRRDGWDRGAPAPPVSTSSDRGRAIAARAVGALVEPWARCTRAGSTVRALEAGHDHRWQIGGTRMARAGGSPAPEARADTHRIRAECDTVLVGTGTVGDDPQLTVRDRNGTPRRAATSARRDGAARPSAERACPDGGVRVAPADARARETRSPSSGRVGSRQVMLEGGPTLAAAFLGAGCVADVIAYVAPALLGAGRGGRRRPRAAVDRRSATAGAGGRGRARR